MKILCLHGIGQQEKDLSWLEEWRTLFRSHLDDSLTDEDIPFLPYDDLFRPKLDSLSRTEYLDALGALLYGRWSLRRERWLWNLSETEKWYLGMVVVFVNNDPLRAKLRDRLEESIKKEKPQILFAHSLGSIIAYDLLSRKPDLLEGRALVTFGSQIANPYVEGTVFGGYLKPLPRGQWFHLFNPNDPAFTASFPFPLFRNAPNFDEIATPFGKPPSWNNLGGFLPDFSAHHSVGYLDHEASKQVLYPALKEGLAAATRGRAITVPFAVPEAPAQRRPPDRRALIIGVNKYENSAYNLEGCVNDAYRMSEVLQESGFQPEDIRLILDNRATADAIRERLDWLLEDVVPGDTRVLTFSGHGTQLPLYGPEGQVDRIATVLAPHDFQWSLETAISDFDLRQRYSNLPYEAHFLMLLDCCHAGGLSRGGVRSRGLNPPDDIRHRLLRWDAQTQTWTKRALPGLNSALSAEMAGEDRATIKLGTAVPLRPHTKAEYNKLRKTFDHFGPYMPIVFQACAADQKAEEYLHGNTSFGAFTYALTTQLRIARNITFKELLARVKKQLKEKEYAQVPDLLGPEEVKSAKVPWGDPLT